MAPIVEGWLGLPAVAGLTLIFAVLRKELASWAAAPAPAGKCYRGSARPARGEGS